MSARWLVFGVWGLAAFSATAWGLKLAARPEPVPAQAVVANIAPLAGGDWSRVLGTSAAPAQSAAAEPPPPPLDSARFQLVGVVAPRRPADGQGVAMLVVDGKPARAYRQGAAIDERLRVQRIEQRRVTIGLRGTEGGFDLELHPLPPPATGVPGAAMPGALPVQGGAVAPALAGQVLPQPGQTLTPEQSEQLTRRTRRTVPMESPSPAETQTGGQAVPTRDVRDRR